MAIQLAGWSTINLSPRNNRRRMNFARTWANLYRVIHRPSTQYPRASEESVTGHPRCAMATRVSVGSELHLRCARYGSWCNRKGYVDEGGARGVQRRWI